MNCLTCVLSVAVALMSAGLLRAEDKPASGDKMVGMGRFVGEWEVDAKWADGNRLQGRTVYAWSLGKKILTTKSFVGKGDKEYQRYEGVMAWHPAKKSLFHISFAYDGAVSETIVENKDNDTIQIGFKSFDPAKPSRVRQTIKFLGKDKFRWTVELKDGEGWKQLIDATWKRKAK
jgi:hypothetical protein